MYILYIFQVSISLLVIEITYIYIFKVAIPLLVIEITYIYI